jgi:hypothetical protein
VKRFSEFGDDRRKRTGIGPRPTGEAAMKAASTSHGARPCACGGDCPGCRAKVVRDPVSEQAADRAADRIADIAPREALAPEASTSAHASGSGLPGPLRDALERQFDEDLGGVRIHTDQRAAEAAQGLGARAFALGDDISFARGQYAPQQAQGMHLLAHEMTHVVQQRRGGVPGIQADNGGRTSIFVYSGVPDFLSCSRDDLDNDENTSCCSDSTRALIPGLYDTARAYTDRALARLRNGDRMDSALARNFGGGAVWQRDEITRRLQLIRNELDHQSQHQVLCRIHRESVLDSASKIDRRLFCRYGVVGSAYLGTRITTLCVDDEGRPVSGWSTLLHEMAHLASVGDLPSREDATDAQRAAGEYETYAGGEAYASATVHALRNADSYSTLVEDIGAESWSPESAAVVAAPRLEAGPAMSLASSPRFGASAGLLWSPLGRDLQMTLGMRALWLSGSAEAATTTPGALQAYAGAEIGLRWISHTSGAQFVLDVAGGGGPYVTVTHQVDTALAARLGLGVRIGDPALGFGISADVMRLLHLNSTGLVGTEADDWFGGITLRGHWGGSSAGAR